ncbi:MAG TPA: response regulator transcription factor [Mycobacteriales bacterium]|nr:response regulator transcription factor [Mycobacteriales bacterium]
MGSGPEAGGASALVVDDDPALRAALTRALQLDGYVVFTAGNGSKALDLVAETPPDVLVLDLMMPFVGGLEVCRRMRAAGDRTPILVLTARDQVSDRVEGLDAGADDYLVKPFALEELLARLRALLRRAKDPPVGEPGEVLSYSDLTIDSASRSLRRGEREVDLTRTEYALLDLLLRNAGRVLTREVIMDRVWGYELEPASNSLEVFIGYLRRKTEAGGEPRLIHTVRGIGYQLRERP